MSMAELSDQLLAYTILGYALAMFGYAAEYAFGVRSAVARVAARPRERELVGAGGPALEPPAVPDREVPDREVPDQGGRIAVVGRVAVGLNVVAAALHIGVLVTRGLAAGRVPWGNMYEFVVAFCLVGSLVWLGLLARRSTVRPLGLFVTLVLVVLLGLAGMAVHTAAGPLVPALNSYWLKIHVSSAAIATGFFLVGAVAAVLTLIRLGYDRGRRNYFYGLGDRLPAAAVLERMTFRIHAFAFPLWTFAVIGGAIWAEQAWGRYWNWDPKETWSFIAWVAYAAYLHARATPSVRRTVAVWFAVGAWMVMMVNLIMVNLVISGLHSYAK